MQATLSKGAGLVSCFGIWRAAAKGRAKQKPKPKWAQQHSRAEGMGARQDMAKSAKIEETANEGSSGLGDVKPAPAGGGESFPPVSGGEHSSLAALEPPQNGIVKCHPSYPAPQMTSGWTRPAMQQYGTHIHIDLGPKTAVSLAAFPCPWETRIRPAGIVASRLKYKQLLQQTVRSLQGTSPVGGGASLSPVGGGESAICEILEFSQHGFFSSRSPLRAIQKVTRLLKATRQDTTRSHIEPDLKFTRNSTGHLRFWKILEESGASDASASLVGGGGSPQITSPEYDEESLSFLGGAGGRQWATVPLYLLLKYASNLNRHHYQMGMGPKTAVSLAAFPGLWETLMGPGGPAASLLKYEQILQQITRSLQGTSPVGGGASLSPVGDGESVTCEILEFFQHGFFSSRSLMRAIQKVTRLLITSPEYEEESLSFLGGVGGRRRTWAPLYSLLKNVPISIDYSQLGGVREAPLLSNGYGSYMLQTRTGGGAARVTKSGTGVEQSQQGTRGGVTEGRAGSPVDMHRGGMEIARDSALAAAIPSGLRNLGDEKVPPPASSGHNPQNQWIDSMMWINRWQQLGGWASAWELHHHVSDEVLTHIGAALDSQEDVPMLGVAAEAEVAVRGHLAGLGNKVAIAIEGPDGILSTTPTSLEVDGDELLAAARAEGLLGPGADVATTPVGREVAKTSELGLTETGHQKDSGHVELLKGPTKDAKEALQRRGICALPAPEIHQDLTSQQQAILGMTIHALGLVEAGLKAGVRIHLLCQKADRLIWRRRVKLGLTEEDSIPTMTTSIAINDCKGPYSPSPTNSPVLRDWDVCKITVGVDGAPGAIQVASTVQVPPAPSKADDDDCF